MSKSIFDIEQATDKSERQRHHMKTNGLQSVSMCKEYKKINLR